VIPLPGPYLPVHVTVSFSLENGGTQTPSELMSALVNWDGKSDRITWIGSPPAVRIQSYCEIGLKAAPSITPASVARPQVAISSSRTVTRTSSPHADGSVAILTWRSRANYTCWPAKLAISFVNFQLCGDRPSCCNLQPSMTGLTLALA
jgi:hypothetical protein